MNEILNILTIWFFQVPVHPFGFATVPVDAISSVSWGSSVSGPKFLYEGKPLHIWTATGLAVTWYSMLMSGNWFVMVMIDVDAVDWWKPVSGYWYWIQETGWLMTEVISDDECGRFSISSWLVDALPQKLKIT